MKKVHAEIEYTRDDGMSVHSDICPPDCNFMNITAEHRKFYHECLDEWLDESGGTGVFYIKEDSYKVEIK